MEHSFVVIGYIAGCDKKRHNLSQMINDQVQLQAKEPSGAGFSFAGNAFKYLVAPLPFQVADLPLFGVYKVMACADALGYFV